MPVIVTRILAEGIASPNQAVEYRDLASGLLLGSGTADALGQWSLPIAYGIILGGIGPGAGQGVGVLVPGAQSGIAAGTGNAAALLAQNQPMVGTAAGLATALGNGLVPAVFIGTAAGVATVTGAGDGFRTKIIGTAAGAAAGTSVLGSSSAFSAEDTFNRADGSLGSDWDIDRTTFLPTISGNKVVAVSGYPAFVRYITGSPASNQYADTYGPTDPGERAVACRIQTDEKQCYRARIYYDDVEYFTYFLILERTNSSGVPTQIGSSYDCGATVPAWLRVEADGTTIRARTSTDGSAWTTRVSTTDSNISGGKPGFWMAGNASDYVDTWRGGDL
jgi:hypothetical protein